MSRASGGLHRYPSPLRYPGGKGKIANYLKLVMLENGLVGREYVEPYAGGASVALSLLFEDYASHIHINDLNPGVHACWDAMLNRTGDLCDLIREAPVTMDTWHTQRAVLASPDPDPLSLAFATFFLNRVNRSGIISGGVIGGLEQHGPYKIDARYNTEDLIRRIRKVGRYRSRISLTGVDAVEFLNSWTDDDDVAPSFVYLDPPYFVKGRGLYDNFYDPTDHAAVADMVHQLAHPWVVSYDAVPQILDLYPDDPCLRYDLSYSASSTPRQGREVMYFGPGLRRPSQGDGEGPSGIAITEVHGAVADWHDRRPTLRAQDLSVG